MTRSEKDAVQDLYALIFREACQVLGLTPSADAEKFGVTRQTFSRWMRGESIPKPEAFVLLVQMLTAGMKQAAAHSSLAAALDATKAVSARLDEQIAAVELERKNNKAMNERIQAALKVGAIEAAKLDAAEKAKRKAAAEIKRKAETKQD